MKNKDPLVSIITVTFNAEDHILKTIESVREQVSSEFEYIVVDGGSSDSTLDIVKGARVADLVVSEKDRGLYDAMNKGVGFASGRYLLFINADDFLYDKYVIHRMERFLSNSTVDIFYGSAIQTYQEKCLKYSPRELSTFWKGMPFSHQAAFIRREYHLKNKYDLSLKISSDYKFLSEAYYSGANFQKVDQIIAKVSSGGLSDTLRFRSIYERWISLRHLEVNNVYNFYYIWLLLDEFCRKAIKLLLPDCIVNRIVQRKYNYEE